MIEGWSWTLKKRWR